ncbi:hypothetical protein GCM10029978_112070 [Actinoallomurus acanthiterrae]
MADPTVSTQERALWTLHRLADGRGICNVGFALRVDARLRWWPLREALNHLVRRHPALRTVIRGDGSQLYRRSLSPDEAAIPLETLACTEEELAEKIRLLTGEPLDLDDGPLARAYMIMLPEGAVVCFVLHHLIADWTTVLAVIGETARLYDAFAMDEPIPPDLAEPVLQRHRPEPTQADLDYWVGHLTGVDASRQVLGCARQVPSRPTFAGGRVDRKLGPEAVAAVSRLRARTRSTHNIVMLAAFYLLLARHGAGPDLVVGVPVDARRADAAQALGYHVSTLPIRLPVDLDADFAALVTATRWSFLEGLDHGRASFEQIQHLLPARSPDWRTPLFRHSFNYRPVSAADEMTMAGLPVRQLEVDHGLSRLDLELVVFADGDSLQLAAVYSTEAHTEEEIAAFLARYESLLVAVDAAGAVPVGDIDPASEADRDVLATVNATGRRWSAEHGDGLLGEILAQADRDPEALAVGDWSYRRLLATVWGLASDLRRCGTGAGDVVGLCLPRGPALAASVLAVWTVGAAYLPLDPALPIERGAYELDNAGVGVLMADADRPDRYAADRTVLLVDDVRAGDPIPPVPSGPLAYVIHTSGSTGRPKAVEVTHDGLANVVRHFAEVLKVTPGDRVLWMTTFSFDISALELLIPLITGARIVPVSDHARLASGELATLIEAEDVTVAQATPTMWRHLGPALGERLHGMRVVCGGEPLTPALAETLLSYGCRLFNAYGPTETTIWSTAVELSRPVPARVPLGGPIANTSLIVRDEAGRPAPLGTPGELCIGGTGVAAGYRGDPDRTADRFRVDAVQGRYYRTGDLATMRIDGTLEFLGRNDRQVKIRGSRIELGEVEAVLERHPDVAEAAAFTQADATGELRLLVACRPATDLNGQAADLADRLREHASRFLGAAAVPSRFLTFDRLPLTGNGKIDYSAVARAADADPGQPPELPELPDDAILRTLVEAWREVLGDHRVGADTHFFLHGGHSLDAVRLAERIHADLGVDVEFDAVFTAPTPVQLAALLTEGGDTA